MVYRIKIYFDYQTPLLFFFLILMVLLWREIPYTTVTTVFDWNSFPFFLFFLLYKPVNVSVIRVNVDITDFNYTHNMTQTAPDKRIQRIFLPQQYFTCFFVCTITMCTFLRVMCKYLVCVFFFFFYTFNSALISNTLPPWRVFLGLFFYIIFLQCCVIRSNAKRALKTYYVTHIGTCWYWVLNVETVANHFS